MKVIVLEPISSDDRRTAMMFGNDSQAGELQLADPARVGNVEGAEDSLHAITPSDDHVSQACVIDEAGTLYLASSLTILSSQSPSGGNGDRRKTVEISSTRR